MIDEPLLPVEKKLIAWCIGLGLVLLGLLVWLSRTFFPGVEAAVQAPPQAYVRVNQVGYSPDDTKLAVVFSAAALPHRFEVLGDADLRGGAASRMQEKIRRWTEPRRRSS